MNFNDLAKSDWEKMRGVQVNGEVIRSLRVIKGLTQDQLAQAADLDVTTLRKMEKGSKAFDIKTVMSLAQTLDAEVTQLITPHSLLPDRRAFQLDMVQRWHDAFLATEQDVLMALHTEDTILEIPGADGLPAAGNFQGIGPVRVHYAQIFQMFRTVEVREDDRLIHAVDNFVFLRTTATFEFIPTGKSYTARHMNEYEFRDGLIARRTVVADYGQLRQAIESEPEA